MNDLLTQGLWSGFLLVQGQEPMLRPQAPNQGKPLATIFYPVVLARVYRG